jgi:hypothetical protein
MSYNASYQSIIKETTKLLQKRRHVHIIRVVSQLTYPTFLRKTFVSFYLSRTIVRLFEFSDITNLYYHKTRLIVISSTIELCEVPYNEKKGLLKPSTHLWG